MREILFRGKRVDNDAWVEGLLIIIWGQYHIIQPNDENTAYPIILKTIGQCTGLTDKNGTKIFEGDICSFGDTDGGRTNYEICWIENRWIVRECSHSGVDDLDLFFCERSVVVGNIFDNPELLEE